MQPGEREVVSVGTYRLDADLPIISIDLEPAASDEVMILKQQRLVDLDAHTYKMIYSCQNTGASPVKVSLKWEDGQLPLNDEAIGPDDELALHEHENFRIDL